MSVIFYKKCSKFNIDLKNAAQNSAKIISFWENCIQSIWARSPCCFSKGPPKQDFLDNYLKTFFGVRSFGNISTMRHIFFWKMFQIQYRFQKCKKNSWKSFFVPEIIAYELVALNCLYEEEHTCHWQSMC